MPIREQALAYTEYLRRRVDHAPDRQMFLQRRVFETFNRLTCMYARRKIGPRILDLGGIDNTFCKTCLDLGCERADAIGVNKNVDFERNRFDFSVGHYDTICANSLIEHLHDPSNMLSETYRALLPGGLFILVTPHWPYCWREFWDAYTHKIPYSHKSLRAALETHGFEVVAMVPWMVDKPDFFWRIPVPWSFRLAALLPFAGLDERVWIPGWLKGRSRTLLALARRPR